MLKYLPRRLSPPFVEKIKSSATGNQKAKLIPVSIKRSLQIILPTGVLVDLVKNQKEGQFRIAV